MHFSLVSRGYIWSLKKEYDKAITDLNKPILLDPKDADVYIYRGDAWAAKGDQEKARADYRRPQP